MRRLAHLAAAVPFVTALIVGGCSEQEPLPEIYRVTAVAETYIPLVENPTASRVLLVGGAEVLRGYFERAGLKCENDGRGPFDIICVRGRPPCGDWNRCRRRLAKGGVVAWAMDVKGLSAADFKKGLESFSFVTANLWMPGLEEWLLVGRVDERRITVDSALDLFVRETAFDDLTASGCETLPEVLASYVGTREQVLPAFEKGDLTAVIRPEHVLGETVPSIGWMERGDVDLDIYAEIEAKWRQYQLARGEIVAGGMLSEKGDVDGAIEKWRTARACNPHDPLLTERLDRLAVNARAFLNVGNVKLATTCCETAVLIDPQDAANVRRLGQCYLMAGRRERGEELLRKADALAIGRAKRMTDDEWRRTDGASD